MTELLEFTKVEYMLDHKIQPGHFSVSCLIREFGWQEREKHWSFIYDVDTGNVYFRPYPEAVQLLIGNAPNKEEAAEQAKKFLKPWLEDSKFHCQEAEKISRLSEKKRRERERHNKENLQENMRQLKDAFMQYYKDGND